MLTSLHIGRQFVVYWSIPQINIIVLLVLVWERHLPFLKQQILDSSKLKEFADDNFKFDENGTKYFRRVENTVGKGEIARYTQFILFLQCLQKTCTADT